MGVRLLDERQPNNVIPLRRAEVSVDAVKVATTPEPTRLYHLIVLAFLLHTPATGDSCGCCGSTWPCGQVRLAFRLREGF